MSHPYEILHLGEILNVKGTSYEESRVADVGAFCKIGNPSHDCACEIRDLFVGVRRVCDRSPWVVSAKVSGNAAGYSMTLTSTTIKDG